MKNIIAQGKTKIVSLDEMDSRFVILEAVDQLTAGDAAKIAKIGRIGAEKTRQCANIFRALEAAGIKTAFVDQPALDRLRCRRVEMLPLEFVIRRYPYGSYFKRHPHLVQEKLRAFDAPVKEIFHKACFVTPPLVDVLVKMSENTAREKYLIQAGWPKGIYTDPYIEIEPTQWAIYDPKSPIGGAPLTRIAAEIPISTVAHIWDDLLIPAFLFLENKLAQITGPYHPIALVDMKFEIGRDVETGDYLISDVIDNDSWRIWPKGDPKAQLDKQGFREGDDLDKVMHNYKIVTEITERF